MRTLNGPPAPPPALRKDLLDLPIPIRNPHKPPAPPLALRKAPLNLLIPTPNPHKGALSRPMGIPNLLKCTLRRHKGILNKGMGEGNTQPGGLRSRRRPIIPTPVPVNAPGTRRHPSTRISTRPRLSTRLFQCTRLFTCTGFHLSTRCSIGNPRPSTRSSIQTRSVPAVLA